MVDREQPLSRPLALAHTRAARLEHRDTTRELHASTPSATMASLEGVPPPAPPPADDAPPPLAVTRDFRPYYSPLELDYLVHLQAHARQSAHAPHGQQTTALSDHRIEHYRQLACGFIERVAARLGLSVSPSPLRRASALERPRCCESCELTLVFLARSPRRTIATAQKLYHRFHLHFSLTDFAYQVRAVPPSGWRWRGTLTDLVPTRARRTSRSRPSSSPPSSRTRSRSCARSRSPPTRSRTSSRAAMASARATRPPRRRTART